MNEKQFKEIKELLILIANKMKHSCDDKFLLEDKDSDYLRKRLNDIK